MSFANSVMTAIELKNLNLAPELPIPVVKARIFSKGVLLYLSAVMCNSLHHALTKLVLQRVGTFQTVQLRMLISALIAVAFMWYQKVPYNFIGAPQHRSLLLARGCLGFLVITLTYYALKYLALPDVASLAFLTPMTTMFASVVFLGEHVVWQQIACSVVSLVGVAIIARPPLLSKLPTEPHRAGAVAACVVAVCSMGIVTTILRKLKDAHSMQSVGYYAICSTIGATACLVFESEWVQGYPGWSDWYSWLLLFGMGSIGFTLQSLQSRALQLEEASYLVNFRYTNLVWATMWEVIIWGDLPDLWTALGSLIVLVSVLYSSTFKAPPKPVSAA